MYKINEIEICNFLSARRRNKDKMHGPRRFAFQLSRGEVADALDHDRLDERDWQNDRSALTMELQAPLHLVAFLFGFGIDGAFYFDKISDRTGLAKSTRIHFELDLGLLHKPATQPPAAG